MQQIQQNLRERGWVNLDTIKTGSSSPSPRTQQREVGNVPRLARRPKARSSHKHTHTHTHTHTPGQPSLQGGGISMPEVRSPQLSKASVAQLSGISTKSWAALHRDHTSSASQLHPAHSGPSPLIGPSSPALTPFSEGSWDPASALAGRGGALEWEGQERSEAPLVNSPTHRNLGIPPVQH